MAELVILKQVFTIENWSQIFASPVEYFINNDSLQITSTLCILIIIICYSSSLINNNYSQVDRLWSLLPWFYAWIYYFKSQESIRCLLFAILPTIWGVRLTYNYWRKGGYKIGEEDYRWVIVRKKYGEVLFQLLNATFVAPFQNIILHLLTTPCYFIIKYEKQTDLQYFDYLFICLFFAVLLVEIIADQQQWNFHQQKKKAKQPLKIPFLTTGLFRYSRHPNFWAEQTLWWVYYLYSSVVTEMYLNWTFTGSLFLSLVFHMSTKLTEEISISKYPLYKKYIEKTSRFLLMPPKGDELKDQ